MNIGIVGAGHIGRALARLAIAHGHQVMLANSRGPGSLADLTAAIGCDAGTVAQAAAFGDVVALAVPFHAIARLAPAHFEGQIVLDANNYYPARDGAIALLDDHLATTSGLVQRHLAGARVVKCFNAIMQDDLEVDAKPAGAAGRRALPLAGDDDDAKRLAAELVDEFGFDPVDAGGLDESWRFERAMPAYCVPLDVSHLKAALAAARRGVELPHGSWRARRPLNAASGDA